MLQLHLFEAAGRERVQQARDQRLMGQAFRERPLLDRLQVLSRQTNIQSAVLAKRGLGIASVASRLALAAGGGLPFTSPDGLEQVLLIGVNLHGRLASSPRCCIVAFRLGMIVFMKTVGSSSTNGTRYT